MAIHYITGSTENKNRGAITNAGTIASKSVNVLLGKTKELGTPQLSTGMEGLHKSVSGGNFAKLIPGEYIIRRVSGKIAGVSNTAMLSGGSDHGQRRSIHYKENIATTFLTALSWTAGANGPTYSYTKSTTTASVGTDGAARQGWGTPGEITYLASGKTPTNADLDTPG